VKRAVVLLSGGIDSATCLYAAREGGWTPHCLIFDYGQRHRREINSAKKIAQRAGCKYSVCKIAFPWKGSSLIDRRKKIPGRSKGIPSTYVPARNIIFLAVFIGANTRDYSGYPDCRPKFYRAFRSVARTGVKFKGVRILTPLIHMSKAQIIRFGKKLGAPYELSWSCYQGGRRPCGKCDSCRFRAKGFREAGEEDTS
jgi:7-cyano-7-deazaguanine synthase